MKINEFCDYNQKNIFLYITIHGSYTNFRPKNRSKGGVAMDLKAVGQRIKMAREAKNLTQEDLAALVDLSATHVSVIERGLKVAKLDTFVAIANALEVSADTLFLLPDPSIHLGNVLECVCHFK